MSDPCTRCLRPLDVAAVLCDSDLCTDCERARFARDAQARKRDALRRVNGGAAPAHRERIDAAIRHAVQTGNEFSANDIRATLQDVPGPLIGARFNAAARAGVIRHVGYIPSSKPNTNGHDIKLWRAA
jgi:hypothetical protein